MAGLGGLALIGLAVQQYLRGNDQAGNTMWSTGGVLFVGGVAAFFYGSSEGAATRAVAA